ncbi:hypothetical protein ACA910_010413 [Epithemia clementina (nom. ined.)]
MNRASVDELLEALAELRQQEAELLTRLAAAHAKERRSDQASRREQDNDADLAQAIQESLTLIEQQHLILVEQQMSLSPVGRAWKLVERVVKLQQEFVSATTGKFSFKAVAVDDMVPMAETLIATQEQYQSNGTPDQVDIGYHWTLSANLARIQTDGLLTKEERMLRNIEAPYNGSAMGDGIYTASDPYSFCGARFGPICILVARLKGNVHEGHHVEERGRSNTLVNGPTNVLKTSGQCIPLLYFESELIRRHDSTWPGNLLVHQCHVKLQAILDSALNHHRHHYYSETQPLHCHSDSFKVATVVPKVLSAVEAYSYFGQHRVPVVAPRNPPVAAHGQFQFGQPNPPVAARGQFQFGP